MAESEVEAYEYIREQLRQRGWNVRAPGRHQAGEVWTQNQCFEHPEIKRCLGGTRPENIVRISEEKLWVIEAKRDRSQLTRALKEAEDDYARPLAAGKRLQVPIISGVAGNDRSGYIVETRLLVGKSYQTVTINGQPATGFLDRQSIERLIETKNPDIAEYRVDQQLFLRTAEQINKTLHKGGINKNDRAKVMAALLLARLGASGPDLEADLPLLIADINSRTHDLLKRHGKVEFHPFVRIEPPTNAENHVKFKAALVQTMQALSDLNIRSAMNSGTDVLGQFYEVFLKYGNGAKEIGIVLTPRHVTRFAVDVLGVRASDLVLDPACGTGGFLVAAFDHVRSRATPAQVEVFKKYNLFGIERESYVAALAIVNMIFRGDGKNNIVEANCFSKFLRKKVIGNVPTAEYVSQPPAAPDQPITRVLMNPPFALKESDEKESRFIETAMKNMADGGLLFAIVPISVVTEGGREIAWRRNAFLANNTLLAVLSMPEELFYPVSNQTVAIIARKGHPHRADAPVFWGRVTNDGFQKSKGKRLPVRSGEPTDMEKFEPLIRAFIGGDRLNDKSIPEFYKVAPIDFTDPILELVPEAYIDSEIPDPTTLSKRLDTQVRENIASLVMIDVQHGTSGRQGTILDAARNSHEVGALRRRRKNPAFRLFRLDSLFELYPGDREIHSVADIPSGNVPVVSCGDTQNGLVGFYDIDKSHIWRDALTIAFNGSPLTTKLHPYDFAAKDDVAVAIPKNSMPPEALVFIQAMLNSERWRYSYYRKCYSAKLGRFEIELPATADGSLDIAAMVAAVEAHPYWWFLAPRLNRLKPAAADFAHSRFERSRRERR